jgi:diaminopimelate decarboxylase
MKRALYNIVSKYLVSRSITNQFSSPLRNLALWGLAINAEGQIVVSGVEVATLVKNFGSPLLVVNRNRLIADASSIQGAICKAGYGSKIVYSYKTNCIPGILDLIHGTGIGAEVISPYELWLAERLKVPGDKIIYNGVDKTEESIVRAVESDILSINIDSLSEIDRIAAVARRLKKKANVGIRLGFLEKSQFGLEIESGEAMEACNRISKFKEVLRLNCIHFSVTSNTRNSDTHRHFAMRALEFFHAVKQQTGMTISYLDIGGGMGVPTTKNMTGVEYGLYRLFGCLPKAPDPNDFEDIETFIESISAEVRKSCARLNLPIPGLILEPGRFVTSRAEFLLSTVLSIKEKSNGIRFAITDAGRLSTTFPCDFEYHEISKADQTIREKILVYNIMGRICTSADWMAKNRILPELFEGDVLLTMDAGAYFSSYSTNFAFPRPAILIVDEDGGCRLLRGAESFEHLTSLDTISINQRSNEYSIK